MAANNLSRDKFRIYVIELQPGARGDRKLMAENPNHDPRKPCLYVGHTHKSVAERFDDHLRNRSTGADIVRKYGVVGLRPDLAANKYAYSREKAEQLENDLARKLRAQGYAVWQR